MASNFASSKPVFLNNVRLQWMDLFTPGDGMDGGAPKYKVVALIDPQSDAATKAKDGLMEAATALWGANAKNVVQNISGNSKAVRNGNSKLDDSGEVRPEFKDMLFISASNKQRPQVIAQKSHNGKFVTITEDGRGMVDGLDVTSDIGYTITPPYRGCYVNLKVTFIAGKAFTTTDKKQIPNQVYAKLEAVQFKSDGEAFGSGPTSAEGFGDEDVAQSTVDDNALFD